MKRIFPIIQSYITALCFFNPRMQPNRIPEYRTASEKRMSSIIFGGNSSCEFTITSKPWWFMPKIVNFIYSHKKITFFSYRYTESLLAIYKGKLIHEWYADGFNEKTEFPMMSMTKTVVSLILGIALQEGYVKSVKQSIFDFYPEAKEYIEASDIKNNLTIEHLITMTSGLKDDSEWRLAEDTGLAGLLRMQSNPPGKKFKYVSVNYHVLGCALQRVLKRDLFDFAKEKIFDPLGMTSVEWRRLPDGSRQGNGGMTMTSRDMLRLGAFFLNNGRCGDRQIVPFNYITQQTSRSRAPYAFGSPFWNNTWFPFSFIGSYETRGHNGQFISMYPNDLVIVRNGWVVKRKSINDKQKNLAGAIFVVPELLAKSTSKNNGTEIKRLIEVAGGVVEKGVNKKTSFVVTENEKLQEAIGFRGVSRNMVRKNKQITEELKQIIEADYLEIPIINFEHLKSMV